MLQSSLVSVNPLSGARTYMHFDDVTRKAYFETALDVQSILEANLVERNESEKHSHWGDGKRVARIPDFIMSMLRRTNRGPEEHPLNFFKWLERHPKFKVRNGDFRGLVTHA